MAKVAAIVLAAGKGTRMKSELVKVMHPLSGMPMISWPVNVVREAGAAVITLVVGHQSEKVREFFADQGDIVFASQEEQLGTGHAVACCSEALSGFTGAILILCGDVPLITPETLQTFLEYHYRQQAVITVLTTCMDNPYGYGRVIKDAAGHVTEIVEEKDASAEQRQINEINSGIYCVDAGFLFTAVADLKNDNAQKEYYLTDIIKTAVAERRTCCAFPIADPMEVMGVNDRVQLAEAGRIIRVRINKALMVAGTTIIDPETTYIDHGVVVGRDTTIYPNVCISGGTVIGDNCVIESSAVIKGCKVGDCVTIKAGSVMEDSVIGNTVAIGPMAHLRSGTELRDEVKIGNFVETKKIIMGAGSKASHLTYLGDATIGSHVNIGCGTITCNYDGVKKHRTVIEDDVFVGSDVQFVAPVSIGRNSLIAAGTTVTKDVPPDSLAIARAPQVNKEGWKLKNK
ncbi:glucosamine-1-phosphate N-acetyltransferase and N-acetylglucosamine-1-phosphate uridylyltransferase [Geotalea daltonii FRC-32]|uniref:Bifunctional protein GlmU n=1 Tax=Geotalea daltonii (strain DSM 22248 / JCM 15807 / FRC-32) TaxID=316067 RepID=GLMU_GEODF|nr:bifunctional UDP-N-acetylglucosamine diphosphorylase/glucosamine-1-phosphate N-acetyltransferase GlmU [Geotalea daltonii]B9M701.1 RecName: Full=Bifunctional protein GlmU; Includes: RecName: Full=UDP-N-acetylglucosamine pyrophosphorylase; AltName: Full=N-acetylglucosamine-1-phosphate uridyltransferase; Includes: RecName: Full=Glucosamine-1-phosphate N-acetyltransferase [Geotalea daltonii FRC-32]ACM22022.1 glucosamine-1-phosphate N-acetyltransferase and N-acetylglucosamine-1-phosphate uridylyltr